MIWYDIYFESPAVRQECIYQSEKGDVELI